MRNHAVRWQRTPGRGAPAGWPGVLLLCLPATLPAPEAPRGPEPPNVILLMADDLGYGDAGYAGHPILRTPNLDGMARDGLRFDRWYAAAPVCSPTRGSCLTGRHPLRYGVTYANAGHLPAAEITLAEVLREHGYLTGHFGKWHLGTLTPEVQDSNRGGPGNALHCSPPWDHGFERCFSTEAKVPTFDPLWRPRGQTDDRWWNPVEDAADAVPFGTSFWDERGQPVDAELRGDTSRITMDRVLGFIEEAVQEQRPFLAVVWFHAPHHPVVAALEEARRYAPQGPFKRHYLACVTAMDAQIGRLRQALESWGVADHTMLWFTSDNGPDHGPGSPGPLRGRKRSLWEGGIRVPGLLVWPEKVARGRTSTVPCVTSDYLPTILDLLDVPWDGPVLDGISLRPVLEGVLQERPCPIAFLQEEQRALVDNRFKLLARSGLAEDEAREFAATEAEGEYLLFDLVADPGETRDLAGEHPEVVRRMAEQLAAWQESLPRGEDGS